MPTYIVTCNPDATPEQVAAAKQHAIDQGGKIGHEYSLIKGFSVTFPNDSISTLASHEHVKDVELDQEPRHSSSSSPLSSSSFLSGHKWSHPPSTATVTDEELANLAKKHQHPLSLADLVRHGRPPLSADALFSSANFTLSLLPIRLAHRILALRNLPFIVVSNPNISKIYHNYLHSLSTLLPWKHRTIANIEAEILFTSVLAELVATHQDTIPTLAKGFLECRRYISPAEVTHFLDTHLRSRIGTRLIAEQHIALHYSSLPHFDPSASPTPCPEHPSYIGVIDTALSPSAIVDSCAGFVADICELKYGLRPRWVIDGQPDATFAFVPMHLEYMVTELLKNAFRATVESGRHREPVVVTIAPEPADPGPPRVTLDPPAAERGAFRSDAIKPLDDNAPGVTIRIRDRGGGIAPEVLPNIWSYSFTTFSEIEDDVLSSGSGQDALGVISAVSSGGSSIAGLGYGLPLSRAYAEYFGGGIAVQSLYGWGTDVYLRLKGVGKIKDLVGGRDVSPGELMCNQPCALGRASASSVAGSPTQQPGCLSCSSCSSCCYCG
ncbi:alpha-ketoacid dehydrogenase kinase [Durotheca rogersii]|uniref:alpha-ketoacid dehydrogenase kinase n=1 Tax=Durotheca rogersii TaxID=419775 RepID=UPI00221EA58F|nr:alpha-ketoacid dehydrogenase kinase [Durotheca rogersii]KAI5861875.1 alpha-ketoacid dehydrogenase kinase [Durotheca rogersii]